MNHNLEIFPDADSVAEAAAIYIAQQARCAVADHDHFNFAVSGGRTPWAMLSLLRDQQMPWAKTTVFQVDERLVSIDDASRNLTLMRAALAGVSAQIVAMPVDRKDLDEAAAEYASLLPDRFDLIHLGLGPDGHTASLVPDDPVLLERTRTVAATGPYQGHRRMTLTYPAIETADQLVWLVTGTEKLGALVLLLAGDESIPAGAITASSSLILADAEAAAGPDHPGRSSQEPSSPGTNPSTTCGPRVSRLVLGVDIGGTGIKVARVDPETGLLNEPAVREETPHPATPKNISGAIGDLAKAAGLFEPVAIGVGFPGVVRHGVVETAAHLDPSWVGLDAAAMLIERLGAEVSVVNDADAAGLAEIRFGSGRGVNGTVVMVTLGTGIGTGLFLDGQLFPNTELGHLVIDGQEAEQVAAGAVKNADHESWAQWAEHLDRYLRELERLLWPDLIILGGGISEAFGLYVDQLHCRTPVVPATLGNDAGIIGAALWANECASETN